MGEVLGVGLLERNQREAAGPQFAPATADDGPLYPAVRPGRLRVEAEAIAVTTTSGLCLVAEEGGGERVVELPGGRLGSPGSCRELHLCQYAPQCRANGSESQMTALAPSSP